MASSLGPPPGLGFTSSPSFSTGAAAGGGAEKRRHRSWWGKSPHKTSGTPSEQPPPPPSEDPSSSTQPPVPVKPSPNRSRQRKRGNSNKPSEATPPPPPPPPQPPSPSPYDRSLQEQSRRGTPRRREPSRPAATPSDSRRTYNTGNTSSRPPGRSHYEEYLNLDEAEDGVANGTLFKAQLRINPHDRTQGYCTIPGLPRDLFVPGWKFQNRAVEGDEVVLRILPLLLWRNQSNPTPTPAGGGNDVSTTMTTNARAPSSSSELQQDNSTLGGGGGESNILPFHLAASKTDKVVVDYDNDDDDDDSEEVVSSLRTVGGGGGGAPATTISPLPIDDENDDMISDLVAAPALMPSASGGDLGVVMDQTPIGLEALDQDNDDDGDGAAGDVSMVSFVAEKLQNATLSGTTAVDKTGKREETFASLQLSLRAAAAAAPPPSQNGTNIVDNNNNSEREQRPWSEATSRNEAVSIISALLHGDYQRWRATGEVVAITSQSERRSTIVGVLKKPQYSRGNELDLIPRDPRLPRALVHPAALRKSLGFAVSNELLNEARSEEVTCRTLVSAKITSWAVQHRYPIVEVMRVVGQAGGLQAEVEALLTQERIYDDDEFTPEILACLPAVPWSISAADVAQRRDLRSTRIFSIDPPTARDLDDALSVEKLDNGFYQIGVHIADVSHFVLPCTALDTEASVRSTSVYLMDRVIPMLPRLLCEELCSLNPGVDRLAFSIIWTMDSQGVIKDTWAGKSIICSCAKLSYPQVQELIDDAGVTFSAEDSCPDGVTLFRGHSWQCVAEDALILHSLASAMRRRRFEVDGALRLDNVRLFFELDDEGKAVGYGVYQQREANRLVEEFMLAANMTAARLISAAYPDKALLRRHTPPNEIKMKQLADTVASLLPDAPLLDVSSAAALQESLTAVRAAVGPSVADVVTLMCTKPMQLAQYFCTGDTESEAEWRHFALAVGHYTHFTSPIRRYPDVLVHRLLAAALEKADGVEGVDGGGENTQLLLGKEGVAEIAAHANERKLAAKATQDGALKLYLASMLLDRPGVFTAIAVGLGGSRFFDAYVPALGIDVRVHTDKILKQDGGGGGAELLNLDWNDTERELSIAVLKHEAAAATTAASNSKAEACYDEIENFETLHNPDDVQPVSLPLVVRPLCSVPLVVAGARSKASGSPAGIQAKLFVKI